MISQNGTEGRVYGGDCELIHVADGKRAEAGHWLARQLDYEMRRRAEGRTADQKETQALCPGCYMIVAYNMLLSLADDNGQSRTELGRCMANVFQMIADGKEFNQEEIEVLLDKDADKDEARRKESWIRSVLEYPRAEDTFPDIVFGPSSVQMRD